MEDVSKRLLHQRLRNRVMEALLSLSDWQESISNVGVGEHFESFFDLFPYDGPPWPNDAMTADEKQCVEQVHSLMVEAIKSGVVRLNNEQYSASGWPQRIESLAEQTLRLMLMRGRFSEDHEEILPQSRDGWPWRERFSGSSD